MMLSRIVWWSCSQLVAWSHSRVVTRARSYLECLLDYQTTRPTDYQTTRLPAPREAGQQALLLALLLPMLLAAAGLLADGGRMLVEYRRAQVAIDGAAFAAAQRVDRNVFFQDQAVILQSGEAVSIGGLYGSMNSRGTVHVTSIEVNGGYVVAHGYFETEPLFLQMFGMGRVHKNLTSQAVPSYGVFRETQ